MNIKIGDWEKVKKLSDDDILVLGERTFGERYKDFYNLRDVLINYFYQ